MPRPRPIEKIHCAACYFAFVSRDRDDIAKAFGVNPRTVTHWTETPEWESALDACGYSGERNFRRTSKLRNRAREAYQTALDNGVAKHQLATVAAKEVGLDARKMRDWARRYGWTDE